jgi:HEAT repeat protein
MTLRMVADKRRSWVPLAALLIASGAVCGCSPRAGSRPAAGSASDPAAARAAVAVLLRVAADAEANGDPAQEEATVRKLAALGQPAIPALAAALSDSDANVRLAAVETLALLHSPPTFAPLLAALQDESAEVRAEAAGGLGALRDERAAQPLLTLYRQDSDPQVRRQCLQALEQLGDAKILAAFVQDTQAADPAVRRSAITALCTMHAARAPELALALVKDPDSDVRKQVLVDCAQAIDSPLGQELLINVALTADPVTALMARRDLSVQLQAKKDGGLTERLRQAGLAALRQPAQAVNAALLLAEVGDPAGAEILIKPLHSPDGVLRFQAAVALRQIADPRSVPALRQSLADPLLLVRCAAYQGLKTIAQQGDAAAHAALAHFDATQCTSAPGR